MTDTKEFTYQKQGEEKSSKEVKDALRKKAILGTLTGPVADFINPTRNNRDYSKVWDKAFKDPLVLEQFKEGGLIGELGHPSDRSDTDPTRSAIIMPEPPKKDAKTGKLMATFHILNTPCGQILKTLCDYGYHIGISSRGDGDVTENFDGTETVNADTYALKGFDAVILPAVKEARMKYITESLNGSKPRKSLKVILNEQLNSATKDDRAVMEEVLSENNIDYKLEEKPSTCNIDNAVNTSKDDAGFTGTNKNVLETLQKTLKELVELRKENTSLKEKISVYNVKEIKLKEDVSKVNKALQNSAQKATAVTTLSKKVSMLQEALGKKQKELEALKNANSELEKSTGDLDKVNALKESISHYRIQVNTLQSQAKSLQENVNLKTKEINRLNENLAQAKQDAETRSKEYKDNILKAKSIVENYKNQCQEITDKYIELRSTMLGVKPSDIKNKLSEKSTLKDIDSICEEMQGYKLSVSKLPFALKENTNISIKGKPSNNGINYKKATDDDAIDDTLLDLIS